MVRISIDGAWICVPEDKSVLECASEHGIYIPHLCHHPDLPEQGSCGLCVVEVEGKEDVKTACTLKPEEGMKITTESERLKKLRSLALDLLLAGHPKDCSSCLKYGRCELQELIRCIGSTGAGMKFRSKGWKRNERNPLIIHDMNRCVLCGRCVRACQKKNGTAVLDYRKKGLETYVGTLHDQPLKDAGCRFCLACARVCPTGAIVDKRLAESTGQGN